jgi:hypothetical protein
MTQDLLVTEAIESYSETIQSAVSLARTLSLVEYSTLSFNTRHITTEWVKKVIGDEKERLKKAKVLVPECAIYTFSLTQVCDSKVIWEAVAEKKAGMKTSGDKANLCAVNRFHPASSVLYLGRSFSPWARIGQHMKLMTSGTYAMHLEQWAVELELDVQMRLYGVPEYRDTPEYERAINVLETGLWDYYKPLLGRRGDK